VEPAWSRKETEGGPPFTPETTNAPPKDNPIVEIRANRNIREYTSRSGEELVNSGSRPIGRDPTKNKSNILAEGIKTETMYSPVDIPRLREQWFEECSDLLGPIPLELPPFREVNHHIPLIDDDIRYNYHLPRCPEALEEELRAKIDRYTTAGWWEMKAVYQASPLLCVPKKSGKLKTVVNARKRNENTYKDVTPFPDQDQIRMDVARAKY
jgi:hypothetical protein